MNAHTRTADIVGHPDGMLAEALRIAGKGLPVVPVPPGAKKPDPTIKHGFLEATADPRQITLWWTRNARNMIGVRTGAVSGLAVLDLDLDIDEATGEVIADGNALLQEVMDRNGWTFPDTVEVRTPRGGRHLYFQHEEGFTSRSHKPEGIDTRCEGAMAIYPPSKRADGKGYGFINPPGLFPIAKAPEWLAEFFRSDYLPGIFEKKAWTATDNDPPPVYSNDIPREEDVVRALEGYWDANDFDHWTRAALALHRFPNGKDIWLQWAARSPKFNRAENMRKWSQTNPKSPIDATAILTRVPKATLSAWGKEHAAKNAEPTPIFRMNERAKKTSTQGNADPGEQTADTGESAGASDNSDAGTTKVEGLIRNGRGQPLAILANVMAILRAAPEWQGVFALDRLAGKVMLLAPIPDASGRKPNDFRPRPMADGDFVKAAEWLQRNGLPAVGKDTVADAMSVIAAERGFDPLVDKLRSLRWDGTPRLETWLETYCGATIDDSQPAAYVRAVGRCFLISAAARALLPGCKVDSSLVLVGPQGIGKSTAGRILAYDWFSDSLPPVNTKDAVDHLRGVWWVEFGEMATATRADVEELKAFLTRTVERFRPAYGRLEIEYPRRNVFFGTSNRDAFLKDTTGNRRFWPVTVTAIDTDRQLADRDQLWAEAVHAFDSGRQWHLTAEETAAAVVQQKAFVIVDERAELLAEKIGGRRVVKALDCCKLIDMKDDRRSQMEVGDMLKALGWSKQHTRTGNVWHAPSVKTPDDERGFEYPDTSFG